MVARVLALFVHLMKVRFLMLLLVVAMLAAGLWFAGFPEPELSEGNELRGGTTASTAQEHVPQLAGDVNGAELQPALPSESVRKAEGGRDLADLLPHEGAILKQLPGATVLDQRVEPLSENLIRRTRLIQPERDRKLVRTVEEWELQGDELVYLKRDGMVANRVLVSVPDGKGGAAVRSQLEAEGFQVRQLRSPYFLIVEAEEASLDTVDNLLGGLAAVADFSAPTDPDYIYFPATIPNDPQLDAQYAHAVMQDYAAWNIETGDREVVVGIFDSGIDPDHEDLSANLWRNPGEIPGNNIDDDNNGAIDDVMGWDFVDDDGTLSDEDDAGHGTFVSGIVAAVGNNGVGVSGVNWEASLVVCSLGETYFSMSGVVDGLDYMEYLRLDRGVNVVATNHSYGSHSKGELLEDAILRQRDAGILFVTTAGNHAENVDSIPFYPACYDVDNIISVASSNDADELASSSSYGLQSISLAAPGEDILSTMPGNLYARASGTSYAAPQVTGAIALAYALAPDTEWAAMRDAVLESADNLPSLSGYLPSGRRLNTYKLLAALANTQQVAIVSPVGTAHLNSSADVLVCEAGVSFEDAPDVPDNPVQWTVSPAEGVVIERLSDVRARVQFPGSGVYRLTASLLTGGIQRTDTRQVIVAEDMASLEDGLLVRWDFEGSGTTVVDSSGNGHDGVLQGGATRMAGVEGMAFHGDGSGGQRIEVSSLPSLPVITIATWVRADSGGEATAFYPRIFESPEYNFFLSFWQGVINADKMKFQVQYDGTASSRWYTLSGSILMKQWYHVAVTFDRSRGTPQIYIDGKLQDPLQQSTGNGDIISQAGMALIGDNDGGTRGLDGLLDMYRIYDRELSADEVCLLASSANLNYAPVIGELDSTQAATGQTWSPVVPVSDRDGPDSLTYQWEVVSGSFTGMSGANTASPTITFGEAGSVSLRLSVGDGSSLVSRDWTIIVDGSLPSVRISTLDTNVLPLPGSGVQVVFTVDEVSDVPLSLAYGLSGDAVAGVDFKPLSGEMVLDAGAETSTLAVELLSRSLGESRTLTLNLLGGAGYQPGDDTSVTLTLLPYTFSNWSAYYQTQANGNGEDWLAQSDANGNGVSNLVEYALGLNPLPVKMSALQQRLPRVELNGSGQLTLTYMRPEGSPGERYLVGYSMLPDGSDFSVLGNQGTVVRHGDGTETVTVTEPLWFDEPQTRFLMLRVQEQ